MADFEELWNRIRRFAGEEFYTVQGLPFTYEVPGNYLVITRDGDQINRSLPRPTSGGRLSRCRSTARRD